MQPTHAVLLAAGMGTRLGRRSLNQPKPLVEVNGVAIVRNALECLAAARMARTTVVIGYLGDQIRSVVGEHVNGMQVRYCENSRYRITGTAHSLRLGLDHVPDDVLVLEGDVFFDRILLEQFLAEPYVDATLVERWHAQIDGSVVELGSDGFVSQWFHKSHRPADFRADGTFKTVNVHRFSRAFVDTHLRPALTSRTARADEPLEASFARSVAANARIRAVLVRRGCWVEIDDEDDLRKAEAVFRGRR